MIINSDIIPPKKVIKKIVKTKKILNEDNFKTYHTIDGKDKKSLWPSILSFMCILAIILVAYSKYNHVTYFTFNTIKTNFKIEEDLKFDNKSLKIDFIYLPDEEQNNPFIMSDNSFSYLVSTTSTSTNDIISKKVKFINKSDKDVKLRKDTRIDLASTTYYLKDDLIINKTNIDTNIDININTDNINTDNIDTDINKNNDVNPDNKEIYKVIGFKGHKNYDLVYASPSMDNKIEDSKNNQLNILKILPEKNIAFTKNTIIDLIAEKKAFAITEKQLLIDKYYELNPSLKKYIDIFDNIKDFVSFDLIINDYTFEGMDENGYPIKISNIDLDIIPIIDIEKAAIYFTKFENRVLNDVVKKYNNVLNIEYTQSPFWMQKVADKENISIRIIK